MTATTNAKDNAAISDKGTRRRPTRTVEGTVRRGGARRGRGVGQKIRSSKGKLSKGKLSKSKGKLDRLRNRRWLRRAGVRVLRGKKD